MPLQGFNFIGNLYEVYIRNCLFMALGVFSQFQGLELSVNVQNTHDLKLKMKKAYWL